MSSNSSVRHIKKHHRFELLSKLSKFGKCLLFPIAMLPIAAILLRIGSAIPSDTAFSDFIRSFLVAGGDVVFKLLPIFFAMSIAFGLTKQQRGEAAIIGFLGASLVMLLLSSGPDPTNNIPAPPFLGGVDLINRIWGNLLLGGTENGVQVGGFHSIFKQAYNDVFANNVFNGVLTGILVAWLYNKFSNVEMPGILGFFSGSRLIPVVTIMTIMIGIFIYVLIWPWVAYLIFLFSQALSEVQGNRWVNASVMFVFGIVNRLLLPFGLHHVPDTLFWFEFGSHPAIGGGEVHGDINIFINGVAEGNTAGTFQTGFFPIMMFGLPAIVLAIWKTAIPEQKLKVLGLLGGAAIVTFFTGITEPIEFAFLYVAPLLYGFHVVMTGLFGFIVGLFGIQLGFGFSAGFLDFILSIPKSLEIINVNYSGINAFFRNPLWIILIGSSAGISYYFGSKYLIFKKDLPTPGRKDNLLYATVDNKPIVNNKEDPLVVASDKFEVAAMYLIKGLGGINNIEDLTFCATRLRLILKSSDHIDETLLKQGGALGTRKLNENSFQVIMGPKVELYANAIKKQMIK